MLLFLVAVIAIPGPVHAAESGPGSSNLRLHLKAEDLYQRGHFKRAYFIYVNELAKSGDKYAQYMAGYMCLNGQGVIQDSAQASAWYRLAAERGAPEFIEVRDQVLESLSAADVDRSDALYIELRNKYSDLAIALELVREARRDLYAGSTGTRLPGGTTGPVTIVDPDSGVPIGGDVYVARSVRRMQVRLDYITDRMNTDPVDADMSNREFEAFAVRGWEVLAVIDDR